MAYPEITKMAKVYLERLGPFVKLESVEFKDTTALLRRHPPSADHPWALLDENGMNWSSKELAAQLKTWTEDPGIKSVVFVVGGPMGVDEEVKKAARWTWARSRTRDRSRASPRSSPRSTAVTS